MSPLEALLAILLLGSGTATLCAVLLHEDPPRRRLALAISGFLGLTALEALLLLTWGQVSSDGAVKAIIPTLR